MIIKKIHKLCLSCMEEHEVYLVKESRQTFFKGEKVEYEAIYEYCDKCDEYTETEDLMAMENGMIKCVFDEPQRAMTPGQAAVFYQDGHVLCGGTIEKMMVN